MAKTFFVLLFLLMCSMNVYAQIRPQILPRPRLVVGIMVDQMRWDYLYRYYNRYSNRGFKRMLNEGFSCENTFIDYLPTVTAVGHSTVYTGSVPAIHGIAGNDFIVNASGKTVYCTEDSTAETVGSVSAEGKMSPKNLLSNTISDELKIATNFNAKAIGIAIKDRGSILPAGHAADAAYWFDDSTGNWITSTYYMQRLPTWVQKFNARQLPKTYLQKDWHTLYPIETYTSSTPDSTRYEGAFAGTNTPTLPVKTSQMFGKGFGILPSTPYGNTYTLEMAKAAVLNEHLGRDETTDFLAVSFSTPDYVGHRFGPNAVETEDIYLRLDLDLANLFDFLDSKVGIGKYTVFLTADHGAANNANFLKDHKMPAGVWAGGPLLSALNKHLETAHGWKNLVLSLANYQVHFNYKTVAENKVNEERLRSDCVAFLQAQPDVAFAVDATKLDEAAMPAVLKSRIENGYNRERSGSIFILPRPGWFSGGATGTSHGTWSPNDAHIPLLWMGWGIKKGATNQRVNMTDIAPTVASLLHIQVPNGCIGEPIPEVLLGDTGMERAK